MNALFFMPVITGDFIANAGIAKIAKKSEIAAKITAATMHAKESPKLKEPLPVLLDEDE